MRALVVGGGSMGRRHLRNLRTLGIEELSLVEPNAERRRAAASEIGAVESSDLDEALEDGPDLVVLATPPYLHIGQAMQVARCGIDLFVEKPLSHGPDGLSELCDLVEQRGSISLVGCNMRFHPGPAKIKQLLAEERIGKLLFVRIHSGSYLPEWRSGTDYRDNYATRAETGGGCILDCIHEIDLARWYAGEIEEVFCSASHRSSLDIATEDVAALICHHASGTMSEIHLDYVQRTYERGCQVVGETGSIFWEFASGQVRWYDAGTETWMSFSQPKDWEINQMYLAEIGHFLDCVHDRRPSALPIAEATAVMRTAFAAKESARQGKMVSTGSVVPA